MNQAERWITAGMKYKDAEIDALKRKLAVAEREMIIVKNFFSKYMITGVSDKTVSDMYIAAHDAAEKEIPK